MNLVQYLLAFGTEVSCSYNIQEIGNSLKFSMSDLELLSRNTWIWSGNTV